MQIPKRKLGNLPYPKNDPLMTSAKFAELQEKFKKLKGQQRPAAEEVKRLAELGDFSENAEYQLAKGKLRGINQRMLEIEEQLKRARIIKPSANKETVQLGHLVTVKLANGAQKVFQILGSSETNPSTGVISQHSPLGLALLGLKVGDIARVQLASKVVEYQIIKIG